MAGSHRARLGWQWRAAATAATLVIISAEAQTRGGLWVNPEQFKPGAETAAAPAAPKAVYALASAIGGELGYVIAKEQIGSRMDPY